MFLLDAVSAMRGCEQRVQRWDFPELDPCQLIQKNGTRGSSLASDHLKHQRGHYLSAINDRFRNPVAIYKFNTWCKDSAWSKKPQFSFFPFRVCGASSMYTLDYWQGLSMKSFGTNSASNAWLHLVKRDYTKLLFQSIWVWLATILPLPYKFGSNHSESYSSSTWHIYFHRSVSNFRRKMSLKFSSTKHPKLSTSCPW